MPEHTYTVKEAAKYLKLSSKTVFRLIKKGALPFFRVGHQWRIKQEDLERQIQETKRRPALGEHFIYFKLGVLNRYKDEAKYWFEEEQFSGRFGIRREYAPKNPEGAKITMDAIGNARFQKVALKDGVIAVCLEDDYYRKSVARIPDEYAHWHNYRIHNPQLQD